MTRRVIPIMVVFLLWMVAIIFMHRGNLIIGLLVLIIPVILFLIWLIPIGPWITARKALVKIDLMDLIIMRLRRSSPSRIVQSLIKAQEAGLKLNAIHLESHYLATKYLAKGSIEQVVKALIIAKEANIRLSFEYATALDLMEGNKLESIDSIKKALAEIEEKSKKMREQVEQENKERQEQLEQENKESQAQSEPDDLQKMYIWTGKSKKNQ